MPDAPVASADSILGPAPPWEANPGEFIAEKIGSPVRLTSGHRDPEHNAAVGGVPNSGHLGYATFDFVPEKMTTAQAAEALAESGVPYDQIIQEGDHVHVQFGGRLRHQVMGRLQKPPPRSVDSILGPPPVDQILGPPPPGSPPAPAPMGVKEHPASIVDRVLGGAKEAAAGLGRGFATDYHARVDPDVAAITGDVAKLRDPNDKIGNAPLLFGLSPNESKVALDFGAMLWDQTYQQVLDKAGHAVNLLTGGKVSTQQAGDVLSVVTPFGEALNTERVLAKGARAMDMSVAAYKRFLAERAGARAKLAAARQGGYRPVYRQGETTGPGGYKTEENTPKPAAKAAPTVDEVLGPEPGKPAVEPPVRAAAERSADVLYQDAREDIKTHRSASPKGETILGAIRRHGGMKNVTKKGVSEDTKYIFDKQRLQGGVINNKTGLHPDDMRGVLQDEGWFGISKFDDTRPAGNKFGDNLTDFYELLSRQAAGKDVYHPTSDTAEQVAHREALERDVIEAGVQPADSHDVAARKLAAFRAENQKFTDLQIRADELGVPHTAETSYDELLGDVLERLAIHHEATGEDWRASAEHGEGEIYDDQLTPEEHEWLSRDFGLESEAAGGPQGPERATEHAGETSHPTAPPDPGSAGGGDHAGAGGGGVGGDGGGDDGYFPGDMPKPGSPEHAGPVVGDEPEPETRIDNALHRLGGHATADKLEAMEFLKKLPARFRDPALQEELGHEIEQRLIDPDHEIPAHLKPAYDAFEQWRDEVDERAHRLRSLKDPDLEPFLPESGHTPRRVKGYTPIFDEAHDPQGEVRDPILGKRSLSKDASSLHSRTAGWVRTNPDGSSYFSRDPPGPQDTDANGRPHANVREATMAEVEANTDIRYYNNPLINTIDEALRLRRVERNIQVLEEIKTNLKLEGLAFQEERFDPETHGWVKVNSNRERPENFRGFDPRQLPQLRGWSFDPRIAEVLQDYYPGEAEPIDNVIAKINRLMIAGLFITPFIHAENVLGHWIVGRGWDWIRPQQMVQLMKTGTQAVAQVWSKGPKYRQLLREGNGLLYGDTQVRNFHQLMLEKAGVEVTGDPETWKQFAQTFKLNEMGIHTAKDLLHLYYRSVQKGLWMASDMFMMQRVLELEEKGQSVRAAIKDAEKDIPNYRVPSRVFGDRAMAQLLKRGQWVVFGRYKYGQWNALARMFDDMMGPKATPAERKEALGKFLVGGFMMAAVIPAGNALLQSVTHKKDARIRPPGPFAIADALWQFATGQKDWAVATSSMISPAPAVDTAVQAKENRDFFGRKIIEEQSTPLGIGVQAAEYASGPLYPIALAEETLKPGGVARAAGRVIGLDIPPEGTRDKQQYFHQREKAEAAKREARDPLQQAVQKAINAVMGH